MSLRSFGRAEWQRRSLIGVAVLVLSTPAFSWAAARTDYAEPMDNAAKLAGTTADAAPTTISLLSGYSLPGLGPHFGTLGAALFGTLCTLALALAVGGFLASDG